MNLRSGALAGTVLAVLTGIRGTKYSFAQQNAKVGGKEARFNGPELHRGGTGLPERGPRFHPSEHPGRHSPEGARRAGDLARGHASLAADPAPTWMGRARLAGGGRRASVGAPCRGHASGGERGGARAPAAAVRAEDGGTGDHALRQRRPAETLAAAYPLRRGLVGAGILGAGFWLRSRVAEDPGGAQGRSLRDQRPEDLDHPGAARELDLLPGAHQGGGE